MQTRPPNNFDLYTCLHAKLFGGGAQLASKYETFVHHQLVSTTFTVFHCSAQHGQQKEREHAPAAGNGTVIHWYRTAQGTKDRLAMDHIHYYCSI